MKFHKKICKKPKKKTANVNKGLVHDESSGSSSEDEVFDTRNDMDYDNIEEVFTSKTCSVTSASGFEKIIDLVEWMKLPWDPVN